jgi:hypothetical protein
MLNDSIIQSTTVVRWITFCHDKYENLIGDIDSNMLEKAKNSTAISGVEEQ